SVVTPSFNQAQFLEKTLRSVLEQAYPHIEYIVVDGGSTDGTLEILERYGDRLRWVSEPDRGQTHAINKGFSMANGSILAWLNSDDLYTPGRLRRSSNTSRRTRRPCLSTGMRRQSMTGTGCMGCAPTSKPATGAVWSRRATSSCSLRPSGGASYGRRSAREVRVSTTRWTTG